MDIINVYLNETDEQSITLQLDENTTAQEILREITGKNQVIKENELNEYALFVKLDSVEGASLRDRMLSSHECPLKIKVFTIKKRVQLETKFRFVIKKCLSNQILMEDNVLSDRNPSEDMIREGVLKKLSKNNWHDRYFILDTKCIFYGKDKKTITKEFTRIDLETVSIQDAPDKGKYCFQLTIAQHNKYILKGNNTQNKEKWMQSISNQCSIVRENREFESINKKIRNEENKRSANDERLVTECYDFEKLVLNEEGIKLLIGLEQKEDIQNCLIKILEYKNFRKKPSQALARAESKNYSGILNSIEEIKFDPLINDVFSQKTLDAKHRKLSDIKKMKSTINKSELDTDLFAEIFQEFISNFIEAKRKIRETSLEYQRMIFDKLYELPLTRWKSRLRSVPEPILLGK